jgi:glutamine amidotransferase
MCRLLGFISPTPTTAAALIGAEECRQWQSMGTVHDDGWGTAWIDTGAEAVARFRTPTEGADDPRLTSALDTDETEGRICHLRMATTGLSDLAENTHPFLAGGVAMAHNGSVHPIERLREYVSLAEVDEVGGTTDSAIIFALVLRRMRQGEAPLAAAAATVRELRADFDHPGMNLLFLTPAELIVVHATAGTAVPYLQGSLPPDHHDHYYRMSWQRFADGATIVSSSGLEHRGWSLIEQNTIMRLTVADGAETIVRL